jgi:hypothetical protein
MRARASAALVRVHGYLFLERLTEASNNFDEISPAHVTLRSEVKHDASFQSLSDWCGDVRFGSIADIRLAAVDVRFTPESGHCRTTLDVR